MSLTLTLTIGKNFPSDRDNRYVFDEYGGSIGRNQDNDFVLPDPNHYLSRKHALVSFDNGAFYLTDTSENGVFLNHSNQPVGKNNTVRLNHGDCLTLGEYDLDVSIGQTEQSGIQAPYETAPESFPEPTPSPHASPWGVEESQDAVPGILDGSMQSAEIPDYSEQTGEGAHRQPDTHSAAEPDHSPAEQDYFVPPSTHQDEAPLDWDKTGFVPVGDSEPQKPDWDKTDFAAPVRPEDRALDNRERHDHAAAQTPVPPQWQGEAVPSPEPAAVNSRARQPESEETAPGSAAEIPEPKPATQQAGSEYSVAGVEALEAFLQGAGLKIEPLSPEAAAALMRLQGKLYREIVQGMMEVLRARFELKNEFRMRQTQIQIRENNPLKFIGQVDDALEYLVSKHSSGFLEPESAFKEAFQDIKDHQVAMVVGMRTAFDSLLKRFDPEQLERRFVKGSKIDSLLPMYRNANCWERYREWYADISAAAEDDFQGLFGNEFTRAYEDQMARLALLRRKQER